MLAGRSLLRSTAVAAVRGRQPFVLTMRQASSSLPNLLSPEVLNIVFSGIIAGLAYPMWKDFRDRRLRSKATYASNVSGHLEAKFVAQPLGVEANHLGYVERDMDMDALANALKTPRNVVLLHGPPKSGKTTLLEHCIDGRKRVAYVSFVSFEATDSGGTFAQLLASAFGVNAHELRDKTWTQSDVQDIVAAALASLSEKSSRSVPLLILDDLHELVLQSSTDLRKSGDLLLRWAVQCCNKGHLNLVLLSNQNNIDDLLFRQIPGFRGHVRRFPVPYASARSIQQALVTTDPTEEDNEGEEEKKSGSELIRDFLPQASKKEEVEEDSTRALTKDEGVYLTSRLGGHYGHLRRAFEQISENTTVYRAVDSIVATEADRLIHMLRGNERKHVPLRDWLLVCASLFQELAEAPWGRRVLVADIMAKHRLNTQATGEVLSILDGMGDNVVEFTELRYVSFYRPVQRAAFRQATTDGWVRLTFQEVGLQRCVAKWDPE